IRLGTSVLVVPYRNPVLVAKMLATLDRLSGGRVILGAGVGWLREEFEALAAPAFEARGAVTDEYLRLMRAAWTSDPVTFEGRYYTVRKVHALPKPAQRRGIPVWIGGPTRPAARRAAPRRGAGPPHPLAPPGLQVPRGATTHRHGRGRVGARVREGREGGLNAGKGGAGEGPLFQGTGAEVTADIRAYQAAGVTHFVFDPTVPELKAALTNVERFAQEVRGKVAKPAQKAER